MATFKRTRLVLQLAFSHLHEWLPPPKSAMKSYDALEGTLAKLGISRIALLRHGNTAPAVNNVDFDRVLTDLGRHQAREAGSSFASDLRPLFPKLLVSPAPRTVETAALLLEEAGEKEAQIERIPVLYDGTMQPMGSQLFRKIGYAPLRNYLDNGDVQDREAAQTVLGAYAHNVTIAMAEAVAALSSRPTHDAGATLWIVGHAIYLPAVALGLSTLLNCDHASQELILSTDTKEAEGYLIDTSLQSVCLLVRPSNKKSRQ